MTKKEFRKEPGYIEALLLARELPVDFDNEDYTETEIME